MTALYLHLTVSWRSDEYMFYSGVASQTALPSADFASALSIQIYAAYKYNIIKAL